MAEKCPYFIGKHWGETGSCGILVENVWPPGYDTSCTPDDQADFNLFHPPLPLEDTPNAGKAFMTTIVRRESGVPTSERQRNSRCPAANATSEPGISRRYESATKV